MKAVFVRLLERLQRASRAADEANAQARLLRRHRAGALRAAIVKAIAADVASVYGGIEGVFEIVASEIDASPLPKGEAWHKKLSDQMFLAIPGTRGAFLDAGVRADLDELRSFRHRARNIYGFELDERLMLAKPPIARKLVAAVRDAIRDLAAGLLGQEDYKALFRQEVQAVRRAEASKSAKPRRKAQRRET
jgi:hypothetical protein